MHKVSLLAFAVVVLAFSSSSRAQQNPSMAPATGSQANPPQATAPAGVPGGDEPTAPPRSSATGEQGADGSSISAEPIGSEPASGDQGMFVFKKQVQEVVLHATVVDDQQRLATHLDKGAFTVVNDGHPQPITSFRREDVPVAIGIVIDNSSSMRDKREQLNEAVLNLVRASNPQDQVFVVNFSQNPYLDQDFTSDIHLLENALHRTAMQGTTALYDAVMAAALHVEKDTPLEKKILLVITDGKDNMSRATIEEATRRLQEKNGPTLYAIGLMGAQNSGRDALRKLADATGGTCFFPGSVNEVGAITVALAHDIRSQYTIAFKPNDDKSSSTFHPIEVEAQAPGYGKLTVRTRNGYYAGETAR